MPFPQEVIGDLYEAIVTEEVEYKGELELSKIAWNLLTQVRRHSAEQSKTTHYVYSARAN